MLKKAMALAVVIIVTPIVSVAGWWDRRHVSKANPT